MKTIGLLFLIAFFPTQLVLAQDAGKDLYNINKAYSELKNFSLHFSYKLSKTAQTGEILLREEGDIQKYDESVRSLIGKTESIQTNTYNLVVEHESKTISIMRVWKKGDKDILKGLQSQLDTVLKHASDIKFSKDKNQYTYRISYQHPQVKMVSITFDRKTFYITRMVIEYVPAMKDINGSDVMKLELTYSNMDRSPKLDPTLFSYERFLIKDRDGFTCTPAYKNFKLSDGYTKR